MKQNVDSAIDKEIPIPPLFPSFSPIPVGAASERMFDTR